MSWEQVTLADTKVDKPAPVPTGTYVFTLQPGASYRTNPYNGVEELNVRFDVTEGEFAGRPVFVSYPDPTALNAAGKPMSWSAQALKKLEIAIGKDALPGEGTAAYLNRVALEGARVVAPLLPGKTYIDKKTGLERTENPKFGIFDISPAA
jgi:hypothetical protein